MTTGLLLKLIGAALALAVGIWIGFGMPGLKRSDSHQEPRGGRRATLRSTWINRISMRHQHTPRRFNEGGRLLRPKGPPAGGASEEPGDSGGRSGVDSQTSQSA